MVELVREICEALEESLAIEKMPLEEQKKWIKSNQKDREYVEVFKRAYTNPMQRPRKLWIMLLQNSIITAKHAYPESALRITIIETILGGERENKFTFDELFTTRKELETLLNEPLTEKTIKKRSIKQRFGQ